MAPARCTRAVSQPMTRSRSAQDRRYVLQGSRSLVEADADVDDWETLLQAAQLFTPGADLQAQQGNAGDAGQGLELSQGDRARRSSGCCALPRQTMPTR